MGRPTPKATLEVARELYCAGYTLVAASSDAGIPYTTARRAAVRENWKERRQRHAEERAKLFGAALEGEHRAYTVEVLGRQAERLEALLKEADVMRDAAHPLLTSDGDPIRDESGKQVYRGVIKCAKDLLFLAQTLQIAHQEQRAILRIPNVSPEKLAPPPPDAQPAIAISPTDSRWDGAIADMQAREAAEPQGGAHGEE